MIKQLFGFCALLFILIACQKENEWMNEGKITGADGRMCACCGGYFIEIKDSVYRFDILPEGTNFDLTKETFPVLVELNWKKKENSCLRDEIIVTDIRKK